MSRKATSDLEAGASTSENGDLPPAPVEPVLRSPYLLHRWGLDQAMPAQRSREIASGFCGALLRHLGPAVEEVVVRNRLAVLALPRLPAPAKPEVIAIGLLVPREASEKSSKALDRGVQAVGEQGFDVAGCELRLEPGRSGSDQAGSWAGPSRLWTSVTPWVSEGDHAGRFAEHRRRCLLDSLAISILGDGDHVEQRLSIERLVGEAQVHDEAWVPGVEPASRSPELRPGPPMHARIAFREPVEGPIVIGRDRLFGMGLLAPLDVPARFS